MGKLYGSMTRIYSQNFFIKTKLKLQHARKKKKGNQFRWCTELVLMKGWSYVGGAYCCFSCSFSFSPQCLSEVFITACTSSLSAWKHLFFFTARWNKFYKTTWGRPQDVDDGTMTFRLVGCPQDHVCCLGGALSKFWIFWGQGSECLRLAVLSRNSLPTNH